MGRRAVRAATEDIQQVTGLLVSQGTSRLDVATAIGLVWVAELKAMGLSTEQIREHLGVLAETIRHRRH